MSASRIAYLHCDGGCDRVWDASPNPTLGKDKGDSSGYQRTEAHKVGWVTLPGGRDLCPECNPTAKPERTT